MSDADHELESVRVVYEHLRATIERDDAGYLVYVQKARHLITTTVLLFAGVSFAAGQMEWAKATWHIWPLLLLGGFAALLLLAAFCAGIMCLQIIDLPVVGVEKLRDSLKDDKVKSIDAAKVYSNLAQNLATTITDVRISQKRRRRRAKWLNHCSLIGAVLTAMFVTYAVGGKLLVQNKSQLGHSTRQTMNYDNPDPSEPQEQPAPEDSQPLVEPSDTIQQNEPTPPQKTLVEPSVLTQKEQTGSTERRGG